MKGYANYTQFTCETIYTRLRSGYKTLGGGELRNQKYSSTCSMSWLLFLAVTAMASSQSWASVRARTVIVLVMQFLHKGPTLQNV